MFIFCMVITDDDDSSAKFEHIYNSYGKQMLFVANKILGNLQDAEDSVQEALMRIASNIDKIDISDSKRLRSYVLTAARNAAIDTLKRDKLRSSKVELDEAYGASSADSSTVIINRMKYESLIKAMREIDPVYRDVLYYRFAEGMSEKDISALLGRKYGTVKMQIKRGKALLIKKLKEGGIADD